MAIIQLTNLQPTSSLNELRYLICDGKRAIEQFKDNEQAGHPLEEVTYVRDLALLLPRGIILVDFDNQASTLKFLDIKAKYKINCRTVKTDRGMHAYFKIDPDREMKNYTNIELACGLFADYKAGGRNAYAIVRQGGIDRSVMHDVALEDVDVLPKWLEPRLKSKNTEPFKELKEGGRNQTLFNYILTLQKQGLDRDEIRDCIHIINEFVLPNPLDTDEVESIIRDDAFLEADELTKQTQGAFRLEAPWFEWEIDKNGKLKLTKFLHNLLADEIIESLNIYLYHGDLYYYQDGYYKRIDEEMGIEHVINNYYPSITNREVGEVMGAIKRSTYREYIPRQDSNVICCLNGRLDLRTGALYEHSMDAYDTQQIPTVYDPTAQSEVLEKVLDTMFPTQGLKDLFEEFLGACLFKNNNYRGALYITGEGANGKSTLLRMITNMIGDQNVSHISPSQMKVGSFDLPELENKLVNLGDDIAENDFGDSTILKKLITGEPIVVQRKYKNPYTLTSYATQIFTANEMPHNSDKSYGAESRRIILPLTVQFTPDNPSYDPNISAKLNTEEVKSALLNHALAGAGRLISNKKFTIPREVEEANREYNIINSTVWSWIEEECIQENELNMQPIAKIYMDFKSWCDEAGIKYEPSRGKFTREILKYFELLDSEPIYVSELGRTQRCFVNKS